MIFKLLPHLPETETLPFPLSQLSSWQDLITDNYKTGKWEESIVMGTV